MGTLPSAVEQGLKYVSETLRSMLQPDVEENAKMVQKGMLLYRQGLVYQLKFENDQVYASVQDVTPVKVRIDLSFFEMSDCGCPIMGLCRHKLAVFFAAYAKIGSVSEWIENWREPLKTKSATAKWGIQRAKDLLKASGTLQPNYDRWLEAFNESFETILTPSKIKNQYVLPELFHVYKLRIRASAPLEKEWKLLYELVAAIFTFQKMIELADVMQYSPGETNRVFSPILDELIDDSEEYIQKLGVQTMPFAFDEFLERLREDSSTLLESNPLFPIERLMLYRLLWTHLFKRKEWREAELSNIAGAPTFEYAIAEIHQLFLLNRDSEALENLQKQGPMIVPLLLQWLELMTSKKEWSRMRPFVEMFVDFSKSYLKEYRTDQQCRHFTRVVIQAILPYCSETKSDDLYERALQYLLPYSYVSYDTFLFEKNDFERWSALQAYIGIDLEWIGKDRVSLLSAQSPETLVILYHQSIQQQIDLKNRQGYRQAVRQLKKLRTVYKKLKRLEEWDEFFELLIEKTKRLRAFHEECKRGKLIHA
ncbi:SWIM zinc finger family protein [Neobacillus sp. D3-1R]|uniref:SWIM zinc finger family protein n=1 Tax=Neobacillus sp. D3-1R TaxID=3445778 RepID=UPI003FA073BD